MTALDEIKLAKQLREANNLIQTLLQENERLKAQLAESERRHQIAVQNAYEDGYNAAKEETAKLLRRTK